MFVIIWRYKVRPGLEEEFEVMYGGKGEWVEFFKQGEGYKGTELLRPASDEWYATIDRWDSREAFEAFRSANRDQYKAIDERCETMTVEEQLVGEYEAI